MNLIMNFRKSIQLILYILLLASILFLSPAPSAYSHMFSTTFNTFIHPKRSFRLIAEPNSGKHVLPGQVIVMLDLINENEIINYRLSPAIEQDHLIHQRIVEASWPIKFERDSSFIFIYENEFNDFPGCSIKSQREGIYLVNCF